MPHSTPLIATLVGAFVVAFVFGGLANRLRLPPLVGYLLAGVVIGPWTPGFVADQPLAAELAEIGVILLMFGVGLHFSLGDLLAVRRIAIPGAVVQIAAATAMGAALAWWLGWGLGAGIVFGLALSVASTVVLLRALEERHLVESERGRVAVGWLVVEDLAMVLALVLLPALAGVLGGKPDASHGGGDNLWLTLTITLAKVVAFVAVMLIVGRRLIPRLLERVAGTGSRELFTLAVLAIALGVAFGAAALFGVSFALGAFFAGMMLNESEFSHQAASDSLPLRDAFAVLFFVSVGMLFDPAILVREPLAVLATFLIITIGKSIVAYLIVRAFGRERMMAATIAVSLAQIGEFSFILIGLGLDLSIVPPMARDLVLAGALLSIVVNPLAFLWLDRLQRAAPPTDTHTSVAQGHTILVGFGRVGSLAGADLKRAGDDLVVVETEADIAERARALGIDTFVGNAVNAELLEAAGVARARRLLVAIPNCLEAGNIIELARERNPGIEVVARAHSDTEMQHLEHCGANRTIMGEREIARRMVEGDAV
ncbi:YbaL family putative K(+) efflux transporter [Tahibacter soli]|uniref:YbaL family putative K(+) efflux transporter n=1 Tax=Tahibacter soli TaxID=2983605 RepID=A0A9X4BI21_9GAMM|nr:YbaL family putative K(+) efflux transporter [Tahibacter soli]MDC8014805.1 YbaL family putative K(+) efflux transporter [Tahibacter soli]